MAPRREPGTVNVFDLWVKRDGTPSARHGRGKRWRVSWVDLDREPHTESFDRKVDAKAREKELVTQFGTGSYVSPTKSKTTVADVHTRWEPTTIHLKPKTRNDRTSTWNVHVEPRWGNREVGRIRKTDVAEWAADMTKAGAGARTVEKAVGVLRLVLDFAVDDGMLLSNPATGVKTPRSTSRRHVYLSVPQVNRLAAEIDDYGPLIRLLAFTGLRWGEATALRVEDVDFTRRRLNIHRNDEDDRGKLVEGTPKTHQTRTVPFPEPIVTELEDQAAGKKQLDRLFTSEQGRPLNGSNFRDRVFLPALARARTLEDGTTDDEFPTLVLHDLRHTAASLAVSSGANVLAVQRMLGHKSASVTLDIYADLFDTDLDDVAVKMGEIIDAG